MAVARATGVQTDISATAVGTVTLTRHASWVTGNLVVAIFNTRSITATLNSPPANWFAIGTTLNGTTQSISAFWHIVDTATDPASWSWTPSASTSYVNIATPYTGFDATNPINASAKSNASSGSATTTTPSITPTVPNCMLVSGVDVAATSRTFSPTAGNPMTEVADLGNGASQQQIVAACYYTDEIWTTATATGTRSITVSSSSTWCGITIAIAPSVAATSLLPPPRTARNSLLRR